MSGHLEVEPLLFRRWRRWRAKRQQRRYDHGQRAMGATVINARPLIWSVLVEYGTATWKEKYRYEEDISQEMIPHEYRVRWEDERFEEAAHEEGTAHARGIVEEGLDAILEELALMVAEAEEEAAWEHEQKELVRQTATRAAREAWATSVSEEANEGPWTEAWSNLAKRLGIPFRPLSVRLTQAPLPQPPSGDLAGSTATLYRFYAADGSLLYIGKTIRSYHQRIRDHQGKEWYPDAANITLEHVPKQLVLTLEAEAIRKEKPRHNVVHNQR